AALDIKLAYVPVLVAALIGKIKQMPAVSLPEKVPDPRLVEPLVERDPARVILVDGLHPDVGPVAIPSEEREALSVGRDARPCLVVVAEEHPSRDDSRRERAAAAGGRERENSCQFTKSAHVCLGSKAFLSPSPTKFSSVSVEKS